MGAEYNISYKNPAENEYNKEKHLLDVFYPDNILGSAPVLIFIHGGTWISGSKDLYSDYGRNFAGYGFVTVIINYRLAIDFRTMAEDCAAALAWVFNNIRRYNGDPARIYLSGHSAGGHLAALIALDPVYLKKYGLVHPVKGLVLIDAFGLQIADYIKSHGAMYMHYISKIFSQDPELWKQASPATFVRNCYFPVIILYGEETYPFIIYDNEQFAKKLTGSPYGTELIKVPGKSHHEMITQFRSAGNSIYKELISRLDVNYIWS